MMVSFLKKCISNKIIFSTFSCKQSLRRGDSSSFLFLHAATEKNPIHTEVKKSFKNDERAMIIQEVSKLI